MEKYLNSISQNAFNYSISILIILPENLLKSRILNYFSTDISSVER